MVVHLIKLIVVLVAASGAVSGKLDSVAQWLKSFSLSVFLLVF